MSVLITRPSPEGEQLVSMLAAQGIAAHHLPLIHFTAGHDLAVLPALLAQLDHDDLVFALSPRALQYAVDALQQHSASWPNQVRYFAIGQTTASALKKACQQPVEYPSQNETSEQLLQLASLQQVSGKKALLLRGNGGRTLLREQLERRGVTVNQCQCYQRVPITYNNEQALIDLLSLNVKIIVVTSGEMLQYLYHLVPEQHHPWLLNCQLIVVSQRIATLAQHIGWQEVRVAENANNDALLRVLIT